jgi:methionine synthase II (cobalamin-independent)
MGAPSLGPFRADHVGSLLRPAHLVEMREKANAGKVDQRTLRRLEDECIRDVVRFQESIGLESITDGEYRRESFHGDFMAKVRGIEFRLMPRPGGGGPFVAFTTGPLEWPDGGIEVENFRFLQRQTSRTAKVTIPSPTMTHFRGGRDAIDAAVYPDLDAFFTDLTEVYRSEIGALAAAGCRYVQLDDTNLAYLCDDSQRARATERGEDLTRLPHDYARLINESTSARSDEMAVCVHLCRGNARSRWFAEGGYEPIAEVIFNELDVDGFFLEYDDERSGDFAPLRFVPKGKKVVLGLITSKRGELENKAAIVRRIEEATEFIDLDQLCLSPQCGFASAMQGNLLSIEDERRKLALVVEIASEVWGA